jgi:hypothetical protein
MRLPDLIEIPSSREIISEFRGYNHRLRIADGEFYDMKNLTSDHYPVLSPRGKRGVYKNNTNKISGLLSKDKLCYVMRDTFYYGNDPMITSLDSSSEKTVVGMGAYALIFPDMKYVNIKGENEFGSMSESFEVELKEWFEGDSCMTVTLCDNTGRQFDHIEDDPWAIYDPTDGETCFDGNSVFVRTVDDWKLSDLYPCFRFGYSSLSESLYIGDKIKIDGFGESNIEDSNDLTFLNGDTEIVAKFGKQLVFKLNALDEGILLYQQSYTTGNNVTITRLIPKHDDYIIESHNRIWSCRYGENSNGEFVNEIFATKLGSFKEWYCLEGTSQDSYYASVGSDGVFTGAIEYGGTPIFFKERCMHRIYGDYPATYQIQTIACSGVQDGCGKSLAIVNSVLFYKARDGIYAYDGSVPVCISEPLGDLSKYNTAVGCAVGLKYYVSMTDSNGKSDMFVYDTSRGMWHKEDSPAITEMVSHNGNGYFLTTEGNASVIYTVNGNDESDVAWMAETGIIGVDDPDTKYISRLDVRMLLTVGTRVTISIQYDSSGEWEHVYTATGTSLQSFSVPIRARRCDHFRLRIQGRGDAKIFALCKNVEQGGSSS